MAFQLQLHPSTFLLSIMINSKFTSYLAFPNHALMISELIKDTKTLHAAMIDNYILSAIEDDLSKYELRLEREVHHPVTYGVALRMNSTKMEKCFRKYTRHFPQKMFEIIKSKLVPVVVSLIYVFLLNIHKVFDQSITFLR